MAARTRKVRAGTIIGSGALSGAIDQKVAAPASAALLHMTHKMTTD
jgi:hypothetical protein